MVALLSQKGETMFSRWRHQNQIMGLHPYEMQTKWGGGHNTVCYEDVFKNTRLYQAFDFIVDDYLEDMVAYHKSMYEMYDSSLKYLQNGVSQCMGP